MSWQGLDEGYLWVILFEIWYKNLVLTKFHLAAYPLACHHNILSIFFTVSTNILTGIVFKTNAIHSFAIAVESLTTPPCDINSARSNSLSLAYPNTAFANSGLNTSIASHANEYRPGASLAAAGDPHRQEAH
jgi:hypothetical protein